MYEHADGASRVRGRFSLMGVALLVMLAACGGSDGAGTTTAVVATEGTATTTTVILEMIDPTTSTVTSTWSIVSCSRPDPLGLVLEAYLVGTTDQIMDSGTLVIHAANGTGTATVEFWQSTGSATSSGETPITVRAGADGALQVVAADGTLTVHCG